MVFIVNSFKKIKIALNSIKEKLRVYGFDKNNKIKKHVAKEAIIL